MFYHGTGESFTAFDIGQAAAAAYGNDVMKVYLSGEKLADYNNQPHEFYRLHNKREQVAYLKKRGYDGWYADMDSDGWGEVSVFSPTRSNPRRRISARLTRRSGTFAILLRTRRMRKKIAPGHIAWMTKSRWGLTMRHAIKSSRTGH